MTVPFKTKEQRAEYMREYRKDHPEAPRDRKGRNRPAKPPPELPQFVGFDGEGTNQADGTQWYTLLACWRGQGPIGQGAPDAYIENYERGLTTSECLTFLVDHTPAAAVAVGFFFNYDVTKMLSSMPTDTIQALWNSGKVLWFDADSRKLWYIKYIPSKMFIVGECKKSTPLTFTFFDPDEHIKHRRDGSRIEATIYDVSGFFQCAFVKALKDWKVDLEYVDFIMAMKAKRNDFVVEDAAEIRRYCLRECEDLTVLMDRLAAALWDAGIYLKQWHGAGAIASELFKMHRVKKHLADIPDEVEPAVLGAYFGGRAQMFRMGEIKGGLYDYDLQSAYPSAAISLPSLADGVWEWHDSYEPTDFAIWLVSWDVTESLQTKRGTEIVYRSLCGPFPYRHKGRIYYPLAGCETWTHNAEVDVAIELFGRDCIQVHGGWVLHPATDAKPFAFLEQVARERIAAKKAGEMKHIPLKLGMNSVYGKLAQSPVDANRMPPYLNYYWAGRITSLTRAKMLRAAHAAGPALVAIATDGLFVTEPQPHLPLGKEPGTWENATEDGPMNDPIVLQAGVMFGKPEWDEKEQQMKSKVVKTRGFGKDSINYEVVKRAWDELGPLGVVTYKERRFIGMGASAGHENFENYGCWRDVERRVQFFPEWGKNFQPRMLIPFSFKPKPGTFEWPLIDNSEWVVCDNALFVEEPSELYVKPTGKTDAEAMANYDEFVREEIQMMRDWKLERDDQPDMLEEYDDDEVD
jgi:hypothetical protein